MILAFLGPPGAGKGTQSRLLADDLNAYLIDVGAHLRALKRQNTPLAKQIQSYIDVGKSIPGDLLIKVIGSDILSHRHKTLIIDNFLRLPEQVDAWLDFARKHNLKLDAVIHLQVDGQTCWQRLSLRRQTQKRADDNYQAFLVRYQQVYKTYINQILKTLKSHHTQIINIDASLPIETVHRQIIKALQKHNLWITPNV